MSCFFSYVDGCSSVTSGVIINNDESKDIVNGITLSRYEEQFDLLID